jgi:site-specific recombinase XerD
MSKANPIRETITPVPRLPTHVVIYRVPASSFWWARCYTPDRRYKIKSTKTTDKRVAFNVARQLYRDSLTESVPAGQLLPKTFKAVALSLLEQEKAASKKSLHVNDESKFNKLIFDHFGNVFLQDVSHADLTALVAKLRERNLAPATKKHYLSLVKKVFRHGVSLGAIDRMPVFPKLGESLKTAQVRDYLTPREYQKLSQTVMRLEKDGAQYRGTRITEEFKLLANFMINSFIRPSDLRVLQHKHVQRRHDPATKTHWLTLRHPATKTTAEPVQTMPAAVEYYDALITFRKREKSNGNATSAYLEPGDYLFLPEFTNRSTAMEKLGKIFARIVKESGLREATGKNITLYSLRHTAIMYRLMNSEADTLSLAKNARTSQAVIEKFYGAHLTTEKARIKLHSFASAHPRRRSK